ncbi:MAG: hypothetical protein ACREBD_12160 [Blastocatellia bacterium]
MIATLQKMNDALLSGDGSGLENIWDEICAQVQYEQSFYWDAYDQTVRSLAEAEVEKLLPHEREAIWLQTPEADVWEFEDESERKPYPVCNDDIVGYLVKERLYHEAGRWSNERIREYLDRVVSSD